MKIIVNFKNREFQDIEKDKDNEKEQNFTIFINFHNYFVHLTI